MIIMLITGVLLNLRYKLVPTQAQKSVAQAQISSGCVKQTAHQTNSLFQKVQSRMRKDRRNGRIYKVFALLLPTFGEISSFQKTDLRVLSI